MQNSFNNRLFRNGVLILIVVLSTLMHLPHFGKELMSIHVWRQTQTQATINSFYEEDMNILNPRRDARGDGEGIFRMEFPLMQWSVALLYKIFGNHLIITRLFMFITGLLSILGIYRLILVLFNKEGPALIGAWAFAFSPSFYYHTINPMPDNLALACSIWGLTLFFIWYKKRSSVFLVAAGLLLALGALCKLPFILFFIVPFVFSIQSCMKGGCNRKVLFHSAVVLWPVLLPVVWYAAVIPDWQGNMIVKGMLDNREPLSVILYYLQHNLFSTLPELLLNYGSTLFFVAGLWFIRKRKAHKDPRFNLLFFLGAGLILYFILQINSIGNVHDYYLFPFLPLLFIIVAYGAWHLWSTNSVVLKYLVVVLLLILPLTCHLRMQNRWNPEKPGFNKDLLEHRDDLRMAAPKNSLVVAGNDDSHFIFLYYIDKKGWAFNENRLTAEMLSEMISKGAEYLYTDSEKILNDEEIKPMLKEVVLKRGSVYVVRVGSRESFI